MNQQTEEKINSTAIVLADLMIPVRTKSMANSRLHWRARAKVVSGERSAVAAALSRLPVATVGREIVQGGHRRTVRSLASRPEALQVVLTRCSPGALDDDNLRSALKAIRDELAAWIGVDDRDPSVEWLYSQQKTKRGLHGVGVLVLVPQGGGV